MRIRKTHCKNGHERSPDNVTADGSCKKCRYERHRKWQLAHPEMARASCRRWSQNNRKADLERQREYRRLNPKKARMTKLRYLYGLTEEQYDSMLLQQNNACLICKRDFTSERRPNVEHCHAANRVRGLLCNNCNRAIGYFNENTQSMLNAITYLASS